MTADWSSSLVGTQLRANALAVEQGLWNAAALHVLAVVIGVASHRGERQIVAFESAQTQVPEDAGADVNQAVHVIIRAAAAVTMSM